MTLSKNILRLMPICLGILALVNCKPTIKDLRTLEEDFIPGLWENKSDSVWKYIYEFKHDKNGNLQGTVHTYFHKLKDSESEIQKVRIRFPELELRFGPPIGIDQSFVLDTTSGTMTSISKSSPQVQAEMKLVKLQDSDYPGILPRHKDVYRYTKPENLDDGIEIGNISEYSGLQECVEEINKQIISKKYGQQFSLLIAHENRLLIEEYFYDHDHSSLENLSSVTKSIVALLTLTAVEDKYINSLNDEISNYVEYNGSTGITILNLLKMRSGMRTEEEAWRTSEDRLHTLLDREIENDPGSVFLYDNGVPNILTAILENASGQDADRYAAKRLFSELGIQNYDWSYNKQNGIPDGSGTLKMRSRDMLKIGLLVMNNGTWNGVELLPEESIKKLSERSTWFDEDKTGYSLLWWIREVNILDRDVELIYASGSGGRFIIIIPELEIVCVITGGNYARPEHYRSWDILFQVLDNIQYSK